METIPVKGQLFRVLPVELKILDPRLNEWGLPQYETAQAAGVDLRSCAHREITLWPESPAVLIPTGFAMHINNPEIVALIIPRSGLGHKSGLVCGNGVGVIDGDYQGQLHVSAWNRNSASDTENIVIKPGDRIAQLLFVPVIRTTWNVVEEFTNSSYRGTGGFGSTGVSF